MKRLIVAVVIVALTASLLFPAPSWAETTARPVEKTSPSRAVELSTTVAAITGIAISPLLGTGVYGAYKYIAATPETRGSLPWFAQPTFFILALVISGLCAAKDTFGVVFPPGWKKPLDIMETLENKLSGLVAAGAVIPLTMTGLSKILVGDAGGGADLHSTQLAMITLGSMDFSWLLNIVTVPVGVIIFGFVWMTSHAINVLILLSPWAAIDAALKSLRLAVLGLLTLTTQLDPKSGGVLAVIIIVFAYFLSGWAFRLTHFGSIFCWDFFTRRRKRFEPAPDANLLFSNSALAEKVPVRTYGRLVKDADGYTFSYRPWLVLPRRTLKVPAGEIVVMRGLFSSALCCEDKPFFVLPPRYCGHEERVAELYGFARVEDAGLRKAWGWVMEALGLRRPRGEAALAAAS